MRYYELRWRYTLDQRRGFGILFNQDENRVFRQCFYEDKTLQPGKDIPDYGSSIDQLERYSTDRWGSGLTREAQAEYEKMMKEATCSFLPGKDRMLTACLTTEKEKVQVRVEKAAYGYTAVCDCGKRNCGHYRAAADLLERRLASLQHAYVVSALPVNKSIFLESDLQTKTAELNNRVMDLSMIEAVREIIRLVVSAGSDDYYRRFHEFLLELAPGYDYDAHFLEDDYQELLMALFEDEGYRKAVLDPGNYADPEDYEGRQRRSNRTCLKRVLKEYQKAVKALDEKENYEEHPYKEFLLKYRNDWPGLLRYYAEGKEKPEQCDLSFLAKIAESPDINLAYIHPVGEKLDQTGYNQETASILRHLADRLPREQKVELYSGLRSYSLSTEEIRNLGREDQLKMIRNTPLSLESFCYIMDDLMADSSAEERGKYILHAIRQARFSRNEPLKKAIVERTALLPDNRLLLSFARYKLEIFGNNTPREGDPERELNTWFSCEYEIVRENSEVYAEFTVSDPESGSILLDAIEKDGIPRLRPSYFQRLGYSPEQIRKVCLEGKEDKYNEAFEQNRDALAAALFEQKNSKFAKGYQQLCDVLADEKILYTESGKVGIDWLIYREDGSNALAFKVGRNRMYVVKDATEFMKSFRTGATAEYGKDLILTHDPENLNETDAAVIKLLMTAKYTKGRKSEAGNKRYITISNALLGNILENLAGRTVFYNEVPCVLRMDPRKIRLKISSDYVLSTDLNKGKQEFLNLVGKGYLLTHAQGKNDAYLDRVEGTTDEMNLISLIDQNPSVSIKPILKDFLKKIYSRFFEMFDVDKAVQRDFVLSQIRLNTFFDFDKGVITARTVILRDKKEIGPEELTDRIDRVKVELLESFLQSLGFADGVLAEESRVLAFFKMDFTRLKTLTNVYLSENLKNKELRSIGKPVIRVTYQNNLARVFLEKSDFTESELEQIIAGLRKKRKYILLDGNRIVDLDSETARDFGETVKDFEMDPKDLYRKKTVSMINAIKAFSHERSCRVDKYLRDMIEEIRSFKEAEITVPHLKAELRDYQTEGFKWLSILTKYGMGGILADDMGLGKTIQIIALLKNDRSRKPSLVVCPKSLVFNWISEFTRFDGSTRVTAVYGPDSRRSELISSIQKNEKAVYITSYDSLRNDISKYSLEFNYIVLDEAQYIKNVHALKTKSVKELKASHRFALTGTPIENSVVDLWSIFDFVMPGYFEELSRFREAETSVIARKAAPFILRRVKEDVLEDLPAKYERILSADMTKEQRKLYDAMRQEARKALEEGGKAFDMLPYLTRLRQVCVDPGMFAEDYRGGSGKLEMLSTLIPEYLEAHHRILIFSQFVKALESVRNVLEKQGISTSFLSGATPAKERVEMMDAFNNGSGTDVFLISLKAGGTGLNLTGADTVIHLDPWWNVAAENQASDRTHRIGQTRNVEVIRLIAGESIEQRVVELQDLKKEVIRQVISDDDGSVTSASLEDIAFVLE